MSTSPQGNPMGLVVSLASVLAACINMYPSTRGSDGGRRRSGGLRTQDERHDETEQREGFRHGEPEEGVRPGQTGRLGLASRRGDVGGPHDADTDTGADRGEAVADGAEIADDLNLGL